MSAEDIRFDWCRLDGCNTRVMWVTSAAPPHPRMILDAQQVSPGTPRAFVLVGAQAFTEPMAVAHLARSHRVPDDEAYRIAINDYGWHLHHRASCPAQQQRRRGVTT